MAALECGDIELVDECSKHLNKKFPDSVRVKRLLGMQYEYTKEYKKALDLYDSLLSKNPSQLLILKRKVRLNLSYYNLQWKPIDEWFFLLTSLTYLSGECVQSSREFKICCWRNSQDFEDSVCWSSAVAGALWDPLITRRIPGVHQPVINSIIEYR